MSKWYEFYSDSASMHFSYLTGDCQFVRIHKNRLPDVLSLFLRARANFNFLNYNANGYMNLSVPLNCYLSVHKFIKKTCMHKQREGDGERRWHVLHSCLLLVCLGEGRWVMQPPFQILSPAAHIHGCCSALAYCSQA